MDRGAVTKSQKGNRRTVSVERKVGECISGKQLDGVRKETHVVSVIIEHLETDAIRDKKDSRLLLHQKRRHRLTERNHQKVQASDGKVLLERRPNCVPTFS